MAETRGRSPTRADDGRIFELERLEETQLGEPQLPRLGDRRGTTV